MEGTEDIVKQLEEKYQYNKITKNNEKKWKLKKKLAIILCLFVDIIIICSINHIKDSIMLEANDRMFSIFYIFVIVFAIVLFDLVILAIIYFKRNTHFEKDKFNFITKLFEKIFTNIRYLPQEKISKEIYLEAKYQERAELYFSNNLIKMNNDSIEIAEVQTMMMQADGKRITEFEGLFSKSKLDKKINAELKIMCNNCNYYDEKTKINMASSDFEMKFDVYSTNKVVAMQILTADVIEKIMELYNKFNYLFDINIIEDNIYIRVHFAEAFEFDEYDREKMINLVETIRNILILKDYMNDIVNKIEI